ncbi:MAG: hypothetical protein JST75_19160 [Bacteroidetes bacterium]|nr:hypothetical protein [Bacteroidota bacterium]
MKRLSAFIYALVIGASSFANPTKNVNEKLLQTFKESFPNAEQVNWKELQETYVVNFVEDGVRNAIVYDKDGTFVSSTRYYQERTLPYYLLINFRKKYPEKKILGITEVSTISDIFYYIKMEDKTVVTTIKLDSEGNLVVVEKLKKAL